MSGIKEGDWVVVVRQCSPKAGGIGRIFLVGEIFHRMYRGPCMKCGGDHSGPYARATARFGPSHTQAPVSWLKKLEGDPITTDVEEQIVHPVSA